MIRHKKIYSRVTPFNPPDPAGRRKRRQLAGERPLDEQAAYLDRSQVDATEPLTDTDLYEGELPAGDVEESPGEAETAGGAGLELLADIYERQLPVGIEGEPDLDTEDLDLLTELELRAGQTSDPLIASDETATYVPPIDPPVIPAHAATRANAEIASGLGVSALDEPYDESHHSSFLMGDDEVSARIREALRADSSTSAYADLIDIESRDGVVVLRDMELDEIRKGQEVDVPHIDLPVAIRDVPWPGRRHGCRCDHPWDAG